MIDLDKEIDDYPEHVCCSCERQHQRKNVTIVSLSDNLGSEVWPRLKNFITENYPAALLIRNYLCANIAKPLSRKTNCHHGGVNGMDYKPLPFLQN